MSILPGGRLTAPEGSLAMPHAKGEWPPELGSLPFGERGAAARAFVQMMDEAGGCGGWVGRWAAECGCCCGRLVRLGWSGVLMDEAGRRGGCVGWQSRAAAAAG